MKAPAFDYQAVGSLDEAFAAYSALGDEAGYLAGGHTLVPALNLRLQAPALLIDISEIPDLHGLEASADGGLRIGAMTRHAALIDSPIVQDRAPLLAQAAPFVAHPAIRNRGTVGGNLCHADPASELPAVMVALGARFTIVGPDGSREVGAEDFFVDLFETACAPGEILTTITVPPRPKGAVCAFDELVRRRGDYAMTGVAVELVPDSAPDHVRIAFCAMGPTPMRATAAEEALRVNGFGPRGRAAASEALSNDLSPDEDSQLPAATRLHLARVLLGRVLARVIEGEAP